jgi:phosphonate transport system substrate-binding protein
MLPDKPARTIQNGQARLETTDRLRVAWLSLAIVALVTLVAACSDGGPTERVDFSRRAPIAKPAPQPTIDGTLRVAIGAMISPQQTFAYYHQLLEHIGRHTERPITMIQRKTYAEINLMLGAGQIDLAFICSGPYTSGKEEFGFKALAVPIVRGTPYYRSYLIVHRDSSLQTLEDLRGKVFAFTDPDSNSGKLVPTYWLQQMDQRPETFFRRTIYSFSHDNAILAVSRHLVDGAAVHSQVWDYLNQRDPEMMVRTRIIKRSRLFGNPPLVASRHLDTATRDRIQATLFQMHQDGEGQDILAELMIDRFTPPREEWYDVLVEMKNCL